MRSIQLLLVSVLFLMSCSNTTVAGGGTDVDNAIVLGKVMADSLGVGQAQVYIMTDDYNPMTGNQAIPARVTETDAQGNFEIENLLPGTYSVEAHHPDGSQMDWSHSFELETDDSLNITMEVKKKHWIMLPIPDSLKMVDFYLYVAGSNMLVEHNAATYTKDHMVLENIPEKEIPFILQGLLFDASVVPVVFHGTIPRFDQDTLDLR
ncbi:MAG: carboxypeptidase-like regulatory domain-containing protein [Fibrobacterales bacterium]